MKMKFNIHSYQFYALLQEDNTHSNTRTLLFNR